MTQLILRHCAPTLAGIKTGNLVNCKAGETVAWMRQMRPLLLSRGIDVRIVCRFKDRVLLYVYRPDLLARDMADPDVRRFLCALGYAPDDLTGCVSRLRKRFPETRFPHEVGLFLGYPLADVLGFIEHDGKNYKCRGCWKVYADEEGARLAFGKYRACTRSLLRSYQCGMGLERLIVANG